MFCNLHLSRRLTENLYVHRLTFFVNIETVFWIRLRLFLFGCSAPKKTSSVPSAGKVMASVFWDAEGILFIDYLEKGKTITREYYSNLLTRLDKKNLWEKTQFAKEKNCLLSGQCTRPQKCCGNGKIKGSALSIVGTSTLFPRFCSLWLLSLPKTQTLPRWSAFFFKSRGDCSCRGVFCRSYEEPLQGRDNGAGINVLVLREIC